MARLRALRVIAIVMLALLALQFEMGMALNLSPGLKERPPVAFGDLVAALAAVGGDAVAHGALGTALAAAAVVTLVGNDGYSHGMATGFLAAFSLYFIQVCTLFVRLRGAARREP